MIGLIAAAVIGIVAGAGLSTLLIRVLDRRFVRRQLREIDRRRIDVAQAMKRDLS